MRAPRDCISVRTVISAGATMTNNIFEDREHAMEANYFRQQDAQLIDKLRRNAQLDDIATSLAAMLEVENPDLLVRARQLGITPETAPAFFLAPLVQMAWAEGSVGRSERKAVLRLARDRGIHPNSPSYAKLGEWLSVMPSDEMFDTAMEVLRSGFAVLPRPEAEERINRVVEACEQVASASGRGLLASLGLANTVSRTEADMLERIAFELHKPPTKPA